MYAASFEGPFAEALRGMHYRASSSARLRGRGGVVGCSIVLGLFGALFLLIACVDGASYYVADGDWASTSAGCAQAIDDGGVTGYLSDYSRSAFDAHVVKWYKRYREMLSMALGVLILLTLRFVSIAAKRRAASNSRIGVEQKMRAGVSPPHLLRPSLRLSSTDGPRTAPEQMPWKVQAKAARCARGKCCC